MLQYQNIDQKNYCNDKEFRKWFNHKPLEIGKPQANGSINGDCSSAYEKPC